MSNLALLPIEDNFQTTLSSPMTDDATDLVLYCDAVPTATIPASFKIGVVIDAGTSKEEVVKVSSIDTILNTMTITSGDRAQNLGNGYAGSLQNHSIGATVTISDSYIYWDAAKTAINSKADTDSPSFTTYVKLPVHADSTARDTAIPSPVNGMMIYNTAAGLVQKYVGGTWVDDTTGTVANATTAVAGKVELSTQAELNAGTATGGTGASLVATPDLIAVASQNQTHNYFADSGSANTIVITPTPAISAYAAGQRFAIKVAAANTGATTVNVNALGAKNLYKNISDPLGGSDLGVGQIIEVEYDGTQFQLMTPVLPTGTVSIYTAGESIDGSTSALPLGKSTGGVGSIVISGNSAEGFGSPGGGFNVVNFGNADGDWKYAQAFTYTNAYATTTLSKIIVCMRKVAAPTDNLTVTIQSDDGAGKPSGTVIANGTSDVVVGSTLTSAANRFDWITFTFSTPPSITSGTKYHLVLNRSTVFDAVNYYQIVSYAADVYSSHNTSTYTLSTTTWASVGVNDIAAYLEFALVGDGKVYKLDATNLNILDYVGWTKDNVTSGNPINVIISGEVDTLTGLTSGRKVWASTSPGTYSHTPPSATGQALIGLGTANSTTSLLIEKTGISLGNTTSTISNATTATSALHTAEAASGTLTVFIQTGFRPKKVIANGTTMDTGTLYGVHRVERNQNTALHNRVTSLNTSNQYVTLQTVASVASSNAFVTGTLVDNGFYLTVTAGNFASISFATLTGFIAES